MALGRCAMACSARRNRNAETRSSIVAGRGGSPGAGRDRPLSVSLLAGIRITIIHLRLSVLVVDRRPARAAILRAAQPVADAVHARTSGARVALRLARLPVLPDDVPE